MFLQFFYFNKHAELDSWQNTPKSGVIHRLCSATCHDLPLRKGLFDIVNVMNVLSMTCA